MIRTEFKMINICNGNLEGLVTSRLKFKWFIFAWTCNLFKPKIYLICKNHTIKEGIMLFSQHKTLSPN